MRRWTSRTGTALAEVGLDSRLGCICRSPGSLTVPRRLRAERDQGDERARPGHKERVQPDDARAPCLR